MGHQGTKKHVRDGGSFFRKRPSVPNVSLGMNKHARERRPRAVDSVLAIEGAKSQLLANK